MRCTYDGAVDRRRLMPDFTDEEAARTDFGSYPAAAFYDDMFRLTRYRTDGALCERLVAESFPPLLWLAEQGVRFVPIFGRQSFQVYGMMKFWGGVGVELWGGVPGPFESGVRAGCAGGVGGG